jgi:hypothetical protein
MHRRDVLLRRIRLVLALFLVGLVASGLTAFPLVWEIDRLTQVLGISADARPESLEGVRAWVARVRDGLHEADARYPLLLYGTDWLAFAHLVIGTAFLGPLRDPVRNRWVIEWGMLACLGVVPLALICGPIRGIPWYHQLLDCSFGVVAIVPLGFCRRWAREMEGLG